MPAATSTRGEALARRLAAFPPTVVAAIILADALAPLTGAIAVNLSACAAAIRHLATVRRVP